MDFDGGGAPGRGPSVEGCAEKQDPAHPIWLKTCMSWNHVPNLV